MSEFDLGQLLKGIIGQSDEQVLDRETDIYRGPGTSVKRTGGEVLSDWIFRFGNTKGLQKKSEERYVTGLKDTYGTQLELIDPEVRKRLNLIDRSGINEKMSKADVARLVKKGQTLESAIATAKATRGIKPEDYQGTDPNAILRNADTARLSQSRQDLTSDPLFIQQQDRYTDAIKRSNQQQANAMTLALMQNQSANKRADNQMQLQLMQQDYNNRRLDMQEARNLRQDRHKAILQIMAGLTDMNRAFQY